MGSCVSVHKDSDSLTKLRFSIGSRNQKLLIPSPVKEKPVAVNAGDRTAADVAVTSPAAAPYTSVGSKDEAFFDSQPWLESDCEDDFVSVNGDFSSSCGNTPVHVDSSLGKPLVNKLGLEEGNGEAPSLDKKKRLSELFKESLRDNEYDEEGKTAPTSTTLAQQLKSTSATSDSGGSSERATPNVVRREEEESLRSSQCCLPKLRSCRSLNDTRKRKSPSRNAAG